MTRRRVTSGPELDPPPALPPVPPERRLAAALRDARVHLAVVEVTIDEAKTLKPRAPAAATAVLRDLGTELAHLAHQIGTV